MEKYMSIKKTVQLILAGILFSVSSAGFGQTRTVGLMVNDSKAFAGYTLFAPKHNTMMYLINNEGLIMHQWGGSKYEPGQSVYLLENGNILRTCMTKGKLSTGGGEGGRVEEYDWDGNLVWVLDFSTETYMQHHDIRPLPNGNIIMLVVEKRTYAEVIAAGFNPSKLQPDVQQKGMMLPDCVYEIEPTRPSGGTIVWEWHVWDHLIQDYDATKENYGVVKDHPELISAAGDQKNIPIFWNHMNSIDYNPALDQIALSVRGNSEVWIIDHSTTTEEAKGHSGGKRGKGGDLLYRWGNPLAYKMGQSTDQKLYQQHDAEWVRPDCPGAGNITVFNNGLGRNYSSIDEFTPPMDADSNYVQTANAAFGPTDFYWTYIANPPGSLYAEAISGAQRLPNGNTIIDDGTHGTFTEVTPGGEIVWKYICPVVLTGSLTQGDTIPDDPARAGEKMNAVFRVYKYPVDYAAFTGKVLTPGGYVEKLPTAVEADDTQLPSSFDLCQNYPNPFNPVTVIRYQLPNPGHVSLTVYDMLGKEVAILIDEYKAAGYHHVQFSTLNRNLSSGIYFYTIRANGWQQTRKMVLAK
jgi:hypothetical protein